ncbi:MAG TPA: aspartate aminotransferase family protein, partial [Reyranella sp.]|nr:aspartate aminotransferase family protein [Reyranella sp.]
EHAARYRTTIAERPQRPEQTYAEAARAWDASTPEQGVPSDEMLEELVTRATPGLHAATGPRFHGWVIGGSHPVGVAADWLTAAWGQNVGNHHASPAGAAAEAVAEKWLVDLLGLPAGSSVGFVTGATVANFVCLAAARSEVLRRVGWDVERLGLFGAPAVDVLIGEEAHASVFSALQALGFGHDRPIWIAVDDQGAMKSDALAAALERCTGPTIVVAQAGQLNSGAFDPLADLAPIARARGAWIHVDGAFGLWARACPSRAHLADGIELADSWATDGHKWLQTPYDCGYAIVRDAEAHRRAMTIAASYLPSVGAGERDPTHLVPELSRRARGFATWAMLRHLGRAGIAEMVERHCRCASLIAQSVGREPGIAVMNRVVLNQAILRFGDDDQKTLDTIARLQADGVAFAGGARWRGVWGMRLSVSNHATTEGEAARTAEAIVAAWRAVK